jgi:parafibromin
LANKRGTIKQTDKDDSGAVDLRVMLDFDVDSTKDILKRERQWRTRTTIQSSGKVFHKNIMALLQSIKAREEGRSRPQQQQAFPPKLPEPTKIARINQPQQTQYNRYDQERFIQQKEVTEEFKIDTMGTHHGMSLKSGASQQQKKPVPAAMPPGRPKEMLPASQARIVSQNAQNKRQSKTPIIIIPSSPNSLITMYNAKEILQDLKFMTTEEKKAIGSQREK